MEEHTKYVKNQAIGERIREERERMRLTRETLAEKLDLSPLYIGQLERGERKMSLDTLVKISDRLHIPTDYLIYGSAIDHEIEISRIIALLNKCSKNELSLVENIIKLILAHRNDRTES